MLDWFVRQIMFLAAAVTGLFVTRDAANFGVIQLVIAVLLLTLLVAILVFWGSILDWLRSWRKAN